MINCGEAVDSLFYPKVFGILLNSKEEVNRINAFDVISNMVYDEKQRHTLAKDDYFKDLFDKMQDIIVKGSPEDEKERSLEASDIRTLEKLSWLIVLISYHEDMFDQIIKMNLLKFVI